MTHVSAAVLHGLPLVRADLTEVHMTQVRYGNRHRATRHVHSGFVGPEWLTTVDSIPATSIARTLADVAKTQSRLTAVIAADAALHRGLCSYEDITLALASITRHRGAPRARQSLALADRRSESPGESWTRVALTHPSLPSPNLQIDVYDERGQLVGSADGGYPDHGVLWEYDGVSKYEALLRPGQSTLDAVLAEKNRENRLIELGWSVVRVISSDLADPHVLRDRIRRAINRSGQAGWLAPRGSWTVTDRTSRRLTPAERLATADHARPTNSATLD
ncbi:MAG: hypothetical protein HY829_10955 [Actinobacteria bacterium]|nr:hypothetical protein [Actinomycetota bacterium]